MKKYFIKISSLLFVFTILFVTLDVAGADYDSPNAFVQEVYTELNIARTNPAEYAYYLEEAMKRFDGNVRITSDGRRIKTHEGTAPYKEAIMVMKNMKALGALSLEKGLCLAAQDLTDSHVRTGNLGFSFPDGTSIWEHRKKYYFANGEGVAMSYGSRSAREVVIALLVDDGLPSRANRKTLLNSDFKYVGAGFSKGEKHPYGASCLFSFATAYLDISLSLDKIVDAPYINNKDYVRGNESKNPLIKEIQRELNMVRCNPKDYANRYIRPISERFSGDYMPDYDGKLRKAHEGKACIEECINVLENAEPCGVLSLETTLCNAAEWFAEDIVKFKRRGHTASDGSSPSDRAKRFGFSGGAGENISYAEYSAREIVIVLLLDDRVPSRGHRNNILNPNYTKLGIGLCYGEEKSDFRSVCIMDFAY